jgi:hypothetical protein
VRITYPAGVSLARCASWVRIASRSQPANSCRWRRVPPPARSWRSRPCGRYRTRGRQRPRQTTWATRSASASSCSPASRLCGACRRTARRSGRPRPRHEVLGLPRVTVPTGLRRCGSDGPERHLEEPHACDQTPRTSSLTRRLAQRRVDERQCAL